MKWTSVILKAAGSLLAVLLLYVLSFGPIYGYVMFSYVNRPGEAANRRNELAETVYAPIFWATQRSPTIRRLGSKYVHVFEREVFAPKEDLSSPPPRIIDSE